MNLFYLSWKNTINKPLGMLLSLLLFALGTGLISILLLVTTQIEDKFAKNQAGVDLIVGAKGSPLQLMLSSMYHIDAPTGNINLQEFESFARGRLGRQQIKTYIPISTGDSYNGHRIIGTTHAYVELYKGELKDGKLWKGLFEATIGSLIAKRLGLKVGDTFASQHGLGGEGEVHGDNPFTVVGVLAPTGTVMDQLILVSKESVWAVHGDVGEETTAQADSTGTEAAATPNDTKSKREVTAMLVLCRNKFGTLTLPRIINKQTNMQAAAPAMEMARLYAITGTGEDALRWLAIIIIIVSGLSIFISLFNSLKERQYELALMRVMGASQLQIFLLVIWEGIILAFMGFVLGLALSHFAMSILAGYMEESYQYAFSNAILKEEYYLFGAAMVVGFIAAVIPAIKASTTDISRTLARK